ncbi:unnamed protein product [Amoebophrya sp. A120]|nr:unnamed protein product [Amoebophrya sp. A120]|eukprot:GSA120T00003412001.1
MVVGSLDHDAGRIGTGSPVSGIKNSIGTTTALQHSTKNRSQPAREEPAVGGLGLLDDIDLSQERSTSSGRGRTTDSRTNSASWSWSSSTTTSGGASSSSSTSATITTSPLDDPYFASLSLDEQEERLRERVPVLLEEMNRASLSTNECEREYGEKKKRHSALLQQWKMAYRQMRSVRGREIDAARPFFEQEERKHRAELQMYTALEGFTDMQQLVDAAKDELADLEEKLHYGAHEVKLSEADQEELSKTTLRILQVQQRRDKAEQVYGSALKQFVTACELLERRKVEAGPVLLEDVRPLFRQMVYYQESLSNLSAEAAEAEARAHQARLDYQAALRGLENINNTIHGLRKSCSASSVREEDLDQEVDDSRESDEEGSRSGSNDFTNDSFTNHDRIATSNPFE